MPWLFRVLFAMLMTSTISAQTLPTNGRSILGGDADDATALFSLLGRQHELGELTIVDIDGQPFDRAMQLAVKSAASTPWNVQIHAPTTGGIRKGDVLLARFWMRCVDSMTGDATVGFVIELNRPDWEKAVEKRFSAPAKWTEFNVPFRASRDFAAGDAHVCFRAGFDRQTLQIGGVEIVNFGDSVEPADLPRTRVSYAGREPDAPWRHAALERIEKIRKGDLEVHVTDAAGAPLADAEVRVTLKRHAFGFGSAVTAELLTTDTADATKYRQVVEQFFNEAVFENDMKWPQTWDGPAPNVEPALDWLLARRIETRGHCLVWPGWRWLPAQLRQYENDPAALRQRTARHVTDLVTRFRGKLTQWDVVNEPWSNHDLQDMLGQDVMIEWFKLAHAADPECMLFLNDYGILEAGGLGGDHQRHFYDTIKFLKDSGAPIHGVGIQSHFSSTLTPPEQLLKILDRFSEFGLPIESTELSLNVDDRELQADYMRDYLIALFSHPNVHGIMLWGFWEGRHWRPEAALFGRDWQIRPHGQAWIDLVHRQWKTDVTLTTDAQGVARTRGFLGEYDLAVTTDGKTRTFPARLSGNGARITVQAN